MTSRRDVPLIPGPAPYLPAIPGPRIPLLETLRCAPRSILAEFYDPGGLTYGMPTYPFKWAPKGWLTKRQLRAKGLRPGGQEPVGQIMWKHRGNRRFGYLYLESLALPVRPMTPAMWRGINAATCARMICPLCEDWKGYCISRILGCCNDCAAAGAR